MAKPKSKEKGYSPEKAQEIIVGVNRILKKYPGVETPFTYPVYFRESLEFYGYQATLDLSLGTVGISFFMDKGLCGHRFQLPFRDTAVGPGLSVESVRDAANNILTLCAVAEEVGAFMKEVGT